MDRRLSAILSEDGRRVDDDEVWMMVGDGITVRVARADAAAGLLPENDAALNALVARFSARHEPDPSLGCALFVHAPEVFVGLLGMGFRLGIVTNKLLAPALTILRNFTLLPVLDTVVGSDTTPHLKPHPEPFLHAADQLELPLQRGGAGRVLQRCRGRPPRRHAHHRRLLRLHTRMSVAEFGADAVIDSLLDLPKAIMMLPMIAEITT